MASLKQSISALAKSGQSVWLDNLSRSLLASGELTRYIDAGVRGVTSNPTIFKQAIADSNDYDQDIASFKGEDVSAESIALAMCVEDVRNAAKAFNGVYESSEGVDGHVSLEVSPLLAHDTQGTIAAGLALWEAVALPNCMIKVPATEAGIPAIQELLKHGVNVNVTLIFSVARYQQVIEAYLTALESRLEAGLAINKLASVASFFVSRVDSAVEKLLGNTRGGKFDGLVGKVALANCVLAYEIFEREFSTARFALLRRNGARVQRPLWASTSTKNPSFRSLMYVNALAVPSSVNTVPPVTLTAMSEEIVAPIPFEPSDVKMANDVIAGLRGAKISFPDLLAELESQGVAAFAQSWGELLAAVSAKSQLTKVA